MSVEQSSPQLDEYVEIYGPDFGPDFYQESLDKQTYEDNIRQEIPGVVEQLNSIKGTGEIKLINVAQRAHEARSAEDVLSQALEQTEGIEIIRRGFESPRVPLTFWHAYDPNFVNPDSFSARVKMFKQEVKAMFPVRQPGSPT